jgi:hypothetical protein
MAETFIVSLGAMPRLWSFGSVSIIKVPEHKKIWIFDFLAKELVRSREPIISLNKRFSEVKEGILLRNRASQIVY